MHVKTLEVGYLMTNCYVVADEESRECAVLDPGGDPYAIADYLDSKCAAIDAIIAEKEALIGELEAYKKSLIFETVTGKRRVC